MVGLPLDVLRVVCGFACLRQRYRWSVVCRGFEFTPAVWRVYISMYGVSSRKALQRLVLLDYDIAWTVVPREHCLWSVHLNKPLRVWSPWTPAALCHRSAMHTRMYFRECRFVHTI